MGLARGGSNPLSHTNRCRCAMKYQDRNEKFLKEKFQNSHLIPHKDDRELRQVRKGLKKQRSKYLRRKAKNDLRELV